MLSSYRDEGTEEVDGVTYQKYAGFYLATEGRKMITALKIAILMRFSVLLVTVVHSFIH